MNTRHALVWGGIAIFLLALWTWQTVQEESAQSTQTAISSSSAAADAGDLRLDVWADASRLSYRDELSFWVGIHNPTSAPVLVSFASFHTPGFKRIGPCWNGSVPVCTRSGSTRSLTRLPVRVDAGATFTFEGDLRATADSGRYAISSVVTWQKVGASITRRKPVVLRAITIEHPIWSKTLLFLRALQGFLKDLALPLALAFVGFWLKEKEDSRAHQRKQEEDARAQQRKEEEEDRARRRREEEEARAQQRRQEEDARIEQRKAAAEKTAQTQQTWNLMLLKSHQNAERHYMPLAGTAGRIVEYWKDLSKVPDRADESLRELTFFSLLQFLARMRRMTQAIGGFYFKDRAGEKLVDLAWTTIVDWCDETFTRGVRDACTKLMPPRASYAEYREAVMNQEPVKEMRAIFDEHLDSFDPIVPVFEVFALVTEFEMNRPYEHWYPAQDPLDVTESRRLATHLSGSRSEELRNLGTQLHAYAGTTPALGSPAATV